jgi:hypothetical protein
MKADKLVIGALALLVLVAFGLMVSSVLANAVAVQPPSSTIYVNNGGVIPFLISLNTVNGNRYYATISISAQSGLTASSNVTAYPASGTSTSNVTIPLGITVSGNLGVYQLNITVTEYNSSTAPQSVLASYKYVTYVHIISPQMLPTLLVASTIASQQKSINILIPQGASGWYIKYKVLYPNTSVAQGLFAHQLSSNLPSINVTVTPSATSGTTNATVTFNVSVTSNLKFGEIPVTIVVYEYLQGTNALYSVQVLHYNFFIVPTNVQSILIASNKFTNFTTVGHVKFGNISISTSNIPASILSVVKGSNNIQILFNDSFTGMISFQSNVTPIAVYADGQKLTQVFYTLPSNMPLGTWDKIGNTIYVYADPSNVTIVYSNTTTTTTSITTGATATGSATISVGSSPSSTSSTWSLTSFYEQHKTLILITIAFLFVVIIAVVLIRR